MALTPEEEAELEQLQAELGAQPQAAGLTPDEQAELDALQAEFNPDDYHGLDYARRLAGSTLQGLTMNLGDELTAGLAAGMAKIGGADAPYSDIYRDIRDTERAEQKRFADQNPKAALAAEVTGALGTGLAAAPRLAGAKFLSNLGKVKQAASIGAIEGAVSGFGGSEADTAAGMVADTAMGAGIGGVAGGVLSKAGDAVRGMGRKLAGKTPTEADKRIMRQLAADLNTTVDDPDLFTKAATKLDDTAGAGGVLGDLGPNMQDVVRHTSRMGAAQGEARDLLAQRQRGMQQELTDTLKRTSGVDETAYQAQKRIAGQQADDAEQFYGAAYRDDLFKASEIPNFSAIADDPLFDRMARESAQELRRTRPEWQAVSDAEGNLKVNLQDIKDMEFWRKVNTKLSQRAQTLFDRGEGETASSIKQGLQDPLQNALKEQSPNYRSGAALYRLAEQEKEALDMGKKFFGTDAKAGTESVQDMLTDAPESVRKAYLTGVTDKVSETIRRKPETGRSILRELNKPEYKERLGAAFRNDEGLEEFLNRSQQIGVQHETFAKQFGSPTAPTARFGDVMDRGAEAVEAAAEIGADGGTFSSVRRLLGKVLPGGKQLSDDDLRLAAKLALDNPQEALSRLEQLYNIPPAEARAIVNALTGAAAQQGGLLTQPEQPQPQQPAGLLY